MLRYRTVGPATTTDEILSTLKSAEPQLRAKGVARAALFGSVARGEARADPAARLGIWEYAGVITMIEDLFPVRVDVSNREGLKAYVRPSAERDAIYAF